MLSVVAWWWQVGGKHLFEPRYLSNMRNMLARHLHREHEFIVVTDTPHLVPPGIRTERITKWQDTPRCRRRMEQYNRAFAAKLGTRILSIDLDVVIVDDITPLVDRREPLVLWRVGYAGVYSGSFQLFDYGALHGLWERFAASPEGFPREVQAHGVPSDQALLNWWIQKNAIKVAAWTERDGIHTYFGDGYESVAKKHNGICAANPALPDGTRIVVLGSADKGVLDEQRYDWCGEWA